MEDLRASKSFIIEKVRHFLCCSSMKLYFTSHSVCIFQTSLLSLLFSSLLFSSLLFSSLLFSSLLFSSLLFSTPLFSSLLFSTPLFSSLFSFLCTLLFPSSPIYSTVININIDIFMNTDKMVYVTVLSCDRLTYIFILNLNTFIGIDAGDSIQLAVKIAYPKEEISKKSKVRGLHIYISHLIYYFYYCFSFIFFCLAFYVSNE